MECGPWKENQGLGVPVLRVADQGVPHCPGLSPDLVGSACIEFEPRKRQEIAATRSLEHAKRLHEKDGRLCAGSASRDGSYLVVFRAFQEPMLPFLGLGAGFIMDPLSGNHPVKQCVVLAHELPCLELGGEPLGALRAFGHHHEAARIAVQAMDETYVIPAEVSAQKINQRGLARRVTLRKEARSLGKHDEVLIFEKNPERRIQRICVSHSFGNSASRLPRTSSP